MSQEEMAGDILRRAADNAELVFHSLGAEGGVIFHDIKPSDLSDLEAPAHVHNLLVEMLEAPEKMGVDQIRATLKLMEIHFRDPGGMTQIAYKGFVSEDPDCPAEGLYLLTVLKCPYNADVIYNARVRRQGWIPQAGHIVDSDFLQQLEKYQEEVEYNNNRSPSQSPSVDIVISPGSSTVLAPDVFKYGTVILSNSNIEDAGLFSIYNKHAIQYRPFPPLSGSVRVTLNSDFETMPGYYRSGWKRKLDLDFPAVSLSKEARFITSIKTSRAGIEISNSSATWLGVCIEGHHFKAGS